MVWDMRPAVASGINHLVLGVRDLAVSDRFYTGGLGFERCGALRTDSGLAMRFYRASPAHHHHLALMQVRDPSQEPSVREWRLDDTHRGIHHFAITYPTRDAFLQQLEYMASTGITFAARGEHGMTHSAYVVDPDGVGVEIVYDVPAAAWVDDVDAALNHFTAIAVTGPDAFEDSTDYAHFGITPGSSVRPAQGPSTP